MTDHGIAVLNKVMASDIDSFNRSAISASADIDNGNVFQLLTQDTTAADGQKEVWYATIPTTANSGLKHLWMAYSPEVVTVVSGSNKFKGIDVDPIHFVNSQGDLIDAFMPQIGDIITLTADALGGTKASALYVQVDATNNSYELTWGTAATISGLSLKYLETTFVSKGTAGAIGETQHVTAYKFECVSVA
jgi:hypothetical protein